MKADRNEVEQDLPLNLRNLLIAAAVVALTVLISAILDGRFA